MNKREGYETIQICSLVIDALEKLDSPQFASRQTFFQTDNLWKIEIRQACEQVIEHYRSIRLLVEAGLTRPAAALSRNVHECYIRFDFLGDNEAELRDWTEWQMTRDYYFARDSLLYDPGMNAEQKQRFQEDINTIQTLLDGIPERRGNTWKSAGVMLAP